jgi:hypothetical protein
MIVFIEDGSGRDRSRHAIYGSAWAISESPSFVQGRIALAEAGRSRF